MLFALQRTFLRWKTAPLSYPALLTAVVSEMYAQVLSLFKPVPGIEARTNCLARPVTRVIGGRERPVVAEKLTFYNISIDGDCERGEVT